MGLTRTTTTTVCTTASKKSKIAVGKSQLYSNYTEEPLKTPVSLKLQHNGKRQLLKLQRTPPAAAFTGFGGDEVKSMLEMSRARKAKLDEMIFKGRAENGEIFPGSKISQLIRQERFEELHAILRKEQPVSPEDFVTAALEDPKDPIPSSSGNGSCEVRDDRSKDDVQLKTRAHPNEHLTRCNRRTEIVPLSRKVRKVNIVNSLPPPRHPTFCLGADIIATFVEEPELSISSRISTAGTYFDPITLD